MTKNLSLLLGGGMLLALTACGDKDIEGNCQPELGDDPDCLIDGECAADCKYDDSCTADFEPIGTHDAALLDRDDPDCDPCLLDGSCDECDYADAPAECDCEKANPPEWCDPFVPGSPQGGGGVSMSAAVAYDSVNDKGRGWVVEGGMGDVEVAPFFSITVSDDRFDTTNNPAYICRMMAEATGDMPAAATSSEITTQASLSGGEDTREYVGYGVTFESGNFTVVDAPQESSAGTIAGCSEKYVDPATWGHENTGLADAVAAGDWQFNWTNIAPVIGELITQPSNDDPADEYDLFDLYGDGENYIVGGTMAKPGAATNAQTAYYYSFAFELGEDWKTVDSGHEDDPDVRLPWDEMLPEGDGAKPATGAYFVSSYNSWSAQYILLDVSGG